MFFVPDTQLHPNGFAKRRQRNYLRVRNNICSPARSDARVRMNKFFGRHDAGERHVESRDPSDVGLAGANVRRTDKAQAFDAVVFPALLQRRPFLFFVRIAGHHEVPRVAEWHVVFPAKFVGEPVTFDAEASLQRILRIVDAGMDYAAVARTGRHAELGKLLDEKNVLPALGDGTGDGATDDATADD